MSKELPPWPVFDNQGYLDPPDDVLLEFETAKSHAAIARLKAALDTLERIRREVDNSDEDGDSLDYVSGWVNEALTAIGAIPE